MATPKRLVLDTDVIINHLRGRKPSSPSVVTRLQDELELSTTRINSYELYHGAYSSRNVGNNLAAVKGFLSTITLLEFDETSAERSAQVETQLEAKGHPIDTRDLFIGCISVTHGYPLLTNNPKHFARIPELLVVSPTDLRL